MKFLSVLLAAAVAAHAAPSDPGKVAIDFLEKVRLRKLDLEPGGDTALSSQTADEKKREIARRLDRMASDLGSDPLEIGEVKLDDNFAAVLVRKVGGFDPSRLQIFPVALVKRGAEWMVAPVPASFENSGAGYAVALRERLKLLENWMLREQVVDLEKLRAQSASRMRRKITASLPEKELRSFSAKEVGEQFVAACARRDQSAVLGLLGGLAAKLPADWAARLKAVEHACGQKSQATPPWRLLTAPDVCRVLVHHEEQKDSGFVSIACLDPAGKQPRLEAIDCDLIRGTEGLWQINLPARFLQNSASSSDDAEEPLDSDHLAAFPEKWTQAHPPAPQPTAELARQMLIQALGAQGMEPILAISQLGGDPKKARNACLQAARLWWAVHDPTAVRHAMPLAFTAGDTAAVGMYQFFSARDPDVLDARVIYFEKSAAGWCWTSEPTERNRENFREWIASESKRWPGQWQPSLLGDSPLLAETDALQASTQDDARNCVEAWLEAIAQGDVAAALPLIARLSDPRSASSALQNLGYDILGVRHTKEKPVITGVYQGTNCAAVGVKVVQEGRSTYPLYPVVQTPRGPRILLEIDLFAGGNRGRDYLNRKAFERLQKSSSATLAAELRGHFAAHQADIQKLSDQPPR